jgi:S-adenosylmethionine hydrolase
MENFSVTEQAIRAEAFIAEKGNSEKHNITFHGQDIYSVYQAYSYLVTVEMMGNAQIQPLMYFQLMNVPMFRGAYMIIKVEHSISQGNMTTTFTGMKMSKVQVPFATSWFTVSNDEEYVDKDVDMSDNGEEMTATDGALIDIEDNELSIAIKKYLNTDGMRCDDFVINVYNELGVTINNRLK